MSDLVQRLRDSVKACRALDRSALLAEAADEIERLRLQPCPYVTGKTTLHCTLTPPPPHPAEAVLARQDELRLVVTENPTLTDAERSAIADAADRYAEITPESAKTAATLRGLLERTK